MNKINLDEILYNHIYSKTDIKNLPELIQCEKDAMLEFGKQLLELAYKNAKIIDDPNSYCGNTGSEYPPDKIVSKQSIIDTIKLME